MYNLRYHVASLAAVFLALAVGLVLGTVVAERGMITDQSSALVVDLQQRFDEINTANDELRAGLEQDRAFATDAADVLTVGRLAGRRVIILVGPVRTDGVGVVEQMITDTGGSALVAEVPVPAMGLGTTEPEGLAGYLYARDIEIAEPGVALERQVAEALAAEWRGEDERELTALLDAAGVLSVDGSIEETVPVDAVVVMAAGPEGADAFGLALARAMSEAGGTSVGAESADSEGGVAASCAAAGIPAVGHVSTPQGRVSLVWALIGRTRGYFGPAAGTDGFYPPLTLED